MVSDRPDPVAGQKADPTPTDIIIWKIRIRQERAAAHRAMIESEDGKGQPSPNVSPRCRPVTLCLPE